MTIQHSEIVRNAVAQAVETAIGASPILQLRTLAPPANCAAADVGVLLASITLPADWMAAPTGGTGTKLGVWSGTIAVSGTAGHYRIKNAAGTVCHEQGTVGRYRTSTTTISVVPGGSSVTVASTNGVTAGMQISGTGVVAGAKVQSVVSATVFTMTRATTSGIANGEALFFTSSTGADLALPSTAMVAGQPITIDFRGLTAPGA